MSSFVENLSRVEEQVRSLQTKIEPFSERAERLNRSVETLSEQVKSVGEDASALVDELAGMRSEIDSLLSTFAEVKTEGLQIDAAQEENRELHNSLTKMFGETFQVVSRFFETARKLGLCENDQEPKFFGKKELEAVKEAMSKSMVEEPMPEPVTEKVEAEPEAVSETEAEPIAEKVESEPEVVSETEAEPIVEEVAEAPEVRKITLEPVAEETTVEPEVLTPEKLPTEIPETDFAAEVPMEESVAMPSLPDVTSFAEILPTVDGEAMDDEPKDNMSEELTEPSPSLEEIAGQLDLPPLQLDAGETVKTNEPTDDEEQKIEDLLNDLSKPIST